MTDETTELQHTPVSTCCNKVRCFLPVRLPLLYFHSELNLIEMVSTFCSFSRHIEDGPNIDKVSWKKNLREPEHVSTHSHSQDKKPPERDLALFPYGFQTRGRSLTAVVIVRDMEVRSDYCRCFS